MIFDGPDSSFDFDWRTLRGEVAEKLARMGMRGADDVERREAAVAVLRARLRHESERRVAQGLPPLSEEHEHELIQRVLQALFGLGRLQALIDDPRIENIDANGYDRVWVTYADGTKELVGPIAGSDEELVEIVRSAAARFGLSERRFDLSHPELDLRLPDGSRLSALMAVCKRPAVSVRRHRMTSLTLDDLVRVGTLSPGLASFLAAAVRARKNIVIAGAMNSGKTTLMRALAAEIPPSERVVTIEQAFELGLDALPDRHPDLVALEAREANQEGEGAVSMARLVRRALRMNADRVIVGEVLGDEILPMLNAMSQGRAGSMCTIHADSSAGVFRRIASYAVQAPERLPLEATNLLIAGSIHFVVFLDVELVTTDRDAWMPLEPVAADSEERLATAGEAAGVPIDPVLEGAGVLRDNSRSRTEWDQVAVRATCEPHQSTATWSRSEGSTRHQAVMEPERAVATGASASWFAERAERDRFIAGGADWSGASWWDEGGVSDGSFSGAGGVEFESPWSRRRSPSVDRGLGGREEGLGAWAESRGDRFPAGDPVGDGFAHDDPERPPRGRSTEWVWLDRARRVLRGGAPGDDEHDAVSHASFDHDPMPTRGSAHYGTSGEEPLVPRRPRVRFKAGKRIRFVSSVREVIDADGLQVVSNEVFRPGADGRAVPGAPLRSDTLDELVRHGFDPSLFDEQW